MSKDKNPKSQSAGPPPTLVEWSFRGFSLLLVLSLIGYFIHEALQPEIRPEFSIHVKEDKIRQVNNRWVVPVEVSNKGTLDVHHLKIQAKLILSEDPRQEETENSEIPLLGCDEQVSLEFWFTHSPKVYPFECQAGSYLLP